MFGSDESIVNQLGRLRLTGARRWSQALAATLFPPRCCLCQFPGASLDLDLCRFCHEELPWIPSHAPGTVFAFEFLPPIDDLVRELKYHGVIANARVLGTLLAEAVERSSASLPRLLVPVPLHVSRLRERGFNQAAAIARYAGRLLGVPLARAAVRRLRDTPSQTSLDVSERLNNVRGAFGVRSLIQRRKLLEAGHVAIVDDVVTTSATVSELRRVLLGAGVRRVDVWAVAHAESRRGNPAP